uniref:Uncharacterized protein n=1 Tax=Chromera velia CCMP2878 TaxID=1169474 RepID=A0A0G4GLZ2_9ALVE|mmetsp:Transcript_9183/g.17987  ORF Transcript_9183/g.17987 Transcript_9183/m.17987 type:complete len:179 (+) Transcript_9183:134-670(+)|eukprot:Cvel_22486.t1-p1 / transcript=Cvel_22486.t1 / gene=Cvel_22486 / organism=Chromera_velia_CCMP2878 / gene_product=hypothetical protein / transcript_product=hypothetical protein / location=Cvel_scaffold2215:2533-3066(-) / protein_length=178 / sequence_SO=supercontig / SO=protein_coding / is_pseudo=false
MSSASQTSGQAALRAVIKGAPKKDIDPQTYVLRATEQPLAWYRSFWSELEQHLTLLDESLSDPSTREGLFNGEIEVETFILQAMPRDLPVTREATIDVWVKTLKERTSPFTKKISSLITIMSASKKNKKRAHTARQVLGKLGKYVEYLGTEMGKEEHTGTTDISDLIVATVQRLLESR